MVRLPTLIVLAAFVGILGADAQVLPGNIIGVVHDQSGGVLPGATVTLTSPALPGGPVTAVTNTQGEYRLTGLTAGTYALTITLTGFGTYEESDLRVTVGGTTERNVRLPLSSVKETITVKGEAPLVDARQTGIEKTLSTEVVESLPTKRFTAAASFMTDQPGVTVGTLDTAYSVNVMGSTGSQTPLMVDGVVTNHPGSGGGWTHFDLDAIGQVSATTLGASAEFQGAAGGVLNVITKSGTNQFHGDAAAFYAPQAFSSRPILLPCNCPDGQTGFTWYKNRDWSSHLGGPIARGRAWFFGGMTFTGQSASTPGQAPLAQKDQYLVWFADPSAKVVWKVSDRITLQQTYYQESFFEPLPHFPTLTRPLETIQRSGGHFPHGASELTAMLSPSTVLTARYALTDLPDERIGFNQDLTTPRRVDSATGINSGNFTAFRSKPRRDEADVKLNTYRSGSRINQNISVGAQIIRNRIWRATVEPGGVVYADLNGNRDQATFTPPSIDAAQYNAQVVWGEDEVTLGHQLTFKLGARVDRLQGLSTDAPAVDSSFQDTGTTIPGLGKLVTWTAVSPRLGVNWKLSEDGSRVLRGTIGRYYDPLTLTAVEAVHPGIAVTTLAKFDPATGAYTNIISVTDPRANIAFDSNVKEPYTNQYSIGLDTKLVSDMALSVSYVHKDSRDLIATVTTGATYGEQAVASPAGGTLRVFPLTSAANKRLFVTTNGPGYYTNYDALLVNVGRRLANGWQGSLGYAYSRLQGLTAGAVDPNDVTSATGRQSQDRPHTLTMTGSWDIPRVDVQFSGNLIVYEGTPYAAVGQISLPQGRRSINLTPLDAFRGPTEKHLSLRVSKILFRNGARRLELSGEARNLMQDASNQSRVTTVYGNANFGLQSSWADPRQLLARARVYF
jgi:hypothetical protein